MNNILDVATQLHSFVIAKSFSPVTDSIEIVAMVESLVQHNHHCLYAQISTHRRVKSLSPCPIILLVLT